MEKIKDWLTNSDGYGYGSGDGYGYGSGDGDGSGYGYGNGSGDGYGDGSGVKSFNNQDVHLVDGVQTIITHIKGAVAKGFILNNDFTLAPCYVVKGNGYFAHGETLRKAHEALHEKIFESMDSDEAIDEFMKKFKPGEKYPGTDFFAWHHYLTGSCLMGRESFVKNHDLDVNALYTVEEFIAVCENDYGGYIIKQLKERWNEV